MEKPQFAPEGLSGQVFTFFEALGPEVDRCTNLYDDVMEALEKPLVLQLYARCGENVVKCARILGINRNTLYKKLRAYGAKGGAHEPARNWIDVRSGNGEAAEGQGFGRHPEALELREIQVGVHAHRLAPPSIHPDVGG
jgi:DNA-binding protein Fis